MRLAATFALLIPAILSAACAGAPDLAPSPAGEGALEVAFLVVDGVYNTEVTAPYDIFHHTPFHTEPGMRVFTVGPSRRPVRTFEGLHIIPDYGWNEAPPADVLVVASAEHSMDTDLQDEAMMAYVRRAGAGADHVLSLCDGAFVLAAAGLLDGREVTTFPADVSRFREMFPDLVVHEDVSFVHDGRAITSAGGAVSFDAALYLVGLLYGDDVARGVAGGLVIDWDPAGVPHVVVEPGP